ncbi:hypothetical protein ACH4NF_04600 [Streptomyces sp. NPDC017248]|uniref:hypothetical protein n=1 Tax=unclassified Streptomyces TaxID=2593676 RepID=UPI0037AC857B
MSDIILTVVPVDPQWQPGQDAAGRAVRALAALTPEDDGTKATWHDEMTFVDCGGNLEQVACPRCDSVLDRTWLRDRVSDVAGAGTLAVVLPCCGTGLSLNDLVYRDPCGFARFDISVWNPGRSWLTDSELNTVGEALGHPVRQVMARY